MSSEENSSVSSASAASGSGSGSKSKSKSASASASASASKSKSQSKSEDKTSASGDSGSKSGSPSPSASASPSGSGSGSTSDHSTSSSGDGSASAEKMASKKIPAMKLPTVTSATDGEPTVQGPIVSPRTRQATGQLLVSPRRAAKAADAASAGMKKRGTGDGETEKFDVEEFWTVGTFSAAFSVWRTYVAEFLTVMLFVFMGTGVVVATAGRYGSADGGTIVAIGFAFGLAIATMVYCAANLSGGHLNPAVTIAIFAAMKMPLLQALGYIIAQVLGAMVGSALVLAVTPYDVGNSVKWGATTLAKDATWITTEMVNISGVLTPQVVTKTYSITQTQGFFMELIMTFVLVFTIFSTAGVAADAKSVGRFAPLSIGFAVFINVMIGATFTGGSLNPARSFGPAVISGVWDDHWIYWGGPIAGGVLAGLCFKYIFVTKEEIRAQVLLAEKLERDNQEAAMMEQERLNRKGM